MFLTCKFKLHNLSNRKRRILMHAFEQYTRAYDNLLEWSKNNLEVLRENGMFRNTYNGKAIASLLPRIKTELHSSLVDSLKSDVAGNLASYFELGEEAGFPIARTFLDAEIDQAALWFSGVGANLEDYNTARNYLLRRAHIDYMPLFFSRPDGATRNRNFSLLVNTEKPQLLAALWLLPAKHALCKPLNAKQNNLIRIDTHAIFTSNSTTAILVPLEVGRTGWQKYKFLDPASELQAQVKTATLLKSGNDFYLAVAFKFEDAESYTPQAYVGIDRGILFNAAYAVVDSRGTVLDLGHYEDELRALQIKHGREREVKARNGQLVTRRDYKTRAYDNILHVLANKILDLAQIHQAQIVLEDLNIQVRGGRVKSRFKKLEHILNYKAKLLGVPVRNVFAAYSSIICHRCGADLERDDRKVTCSECGYAGHSDDNAAVNIARRALYKKKDWEKHGGYRAFHKSVSQTSALLKQE